MIFFIFYYVFLLWYGIHLSFCSVEVEAIEKLPWLREIITFSVSFFGKNDFALRFPQILVSFFSLLLFFSIAKKILKKDFLFATIIFALIPGFIISSLIINKSIYILFLVLLFIRIYLFNPYLSYFLLAFYSILDGSFIVLYVGLLFYAIYKKDNFLLVLALILLMLNANYFNYKIGGKPRGYFLDVFFVYTLIFSPFVFFYFLYSIYKAFFYKKDVIFFISSTALIISFLFSFRQRIKIDDYAPFVLPYVIWMIKIFFNSYRVRLPRFRKGYKILFVILFGSLILFDIVLFLNYLTPARKISNEFYFIKPLATKLKAYNLKIKCNNESICKSLYFYGVKAGDLYLHYSKSKKSVTILKDNSVLMEFNVSKLNTF
jgi:hypothetical protein